MREIGAIAFDHHQNKHALIILVSFLILVVFITSIVIFYISNNIVLTELGYKIIQLENNKIDLEEENKRLELTVESLSALSRIEKIACNQLGMVRPKEVNFIAFNRIAKVNSTNSTRVISNNNEEKSKFWASSDAEKINDLILGVLK